MKCHTQARPYACACIAYIAYLALYVVYKSAAGPGWLESRSPRPSQISHSLSISRGGLSQLIRSPQMIHTVVGPCAGDVSMNQRALPAVFPFPPHAATRYATLHACVSQWVSGSSRQFAKISPLLWIGQPPSERVRVAASRPPLQLLAVGQQFSCIGTAR